MLVGRSFLLLWRILKMDPFIDLFPVYRYIPRRGNTDPDIVLIGLNNLNLDIITDHDFLFTLSGKNQQFSHLLRVITSYIISELMSRVFVLKIGALGLTMVSCIIITGVGRGVRGHNIISSSIDLTLHCGTS